MKFKFSVLMAGFFLMACGPENALKDLIDEINPAESTETSFVCFQDSDCVYTGRINIPTSSDECQCGYMCYGELVNVEENQKREKAYQNLCGGGYKPGDPIPGTNTGCPIGLHFFKTGFSQDRAGLQQRFLRHDAGEMNS